MILLLEPYRQIMVQFLQTARLLQSNFCQKRIQPAVEGFDFALAFRMVRLGMQQLDTKFGTSCLQPITPILLAVVHVDGLRLSVGKDGFSERIFDDVDLLVGVEPGPDYKARRIVDPGRQIRLLLLSVLADRQIRPVLDVSLIQHAAVRFGKAA